MHRRRNRRSRLPATDGGIRRGIRLHPRLGLDAAGLQGRKLLDGGVGDSIPLEYFESIGYQKNVVILTQPQGYQKKHLKLMPLMRLALRKYPKMIHAMDVRHEMYNRQLDYVAQAEREGRCMVIRPDEPIPIGHISHDADQMRKVYEMGRKAGEKQIEKIKAYYED